MTNPGIKYVSYALCTMLALSAVLAIASEAASKMVRVEGGPVVGIVARDVTAYKGIPYAAPPVGPFRWRAPQPSAKWTTPVGKDYGHDCMQLPFPSDAAPLGTAPAEDCLYLNIWAPAKAASNKLPVMFWVYGGGWVNGGSSPSVYDGSQFARAGVVLVSFNYRLGRFGFFAHPALKGENAAEAIGNYGYMDQIAALKWVRRNIAAFGGDRDNITVFGESAGGFSVHMLMTTKLTDGLFKRAIVESGGGRLGLNTTYLDKVSAGGQPSAEEIGVAFATKKGIVGTDATALAKLRALPANEIVDGTNMATMFAAAATWSGPIIDSTIVRDDVGAMYAAGMQHPVPMIVGANSMDVGFVSEKTKVALFASFGSSAEKAAKAYDPSGSADFRDLALMVGGDQFMIEPARYVARLIADHGQRAYMYRFSYVAESMRKEWKGAPHATEIPYVFDTVKARYENALTPPDNKAAQAMNAYWVNFAKTGDPNGTELPNWPVFNKTSNMLMNFTNNGPLAMPDPLKDRLDLTAEKVAKP